MDERTGAGRPRRQRFASLRLAMQGIRWRRWASLATFVVALLATAGAALGPLYARSADYSLARQRLVEAATPTTGVLVSASNSGQTEYPPSDLLTTVDEAAANPELDAAYAPSQSSVARSDILVSDETGRVLGKAPVAWRENECRAVPIIAGDCPTGVGQALIGRRMAADSGLRVGDTLEVHLTERSANVFTITGIYDESRPDPVVYAVDTPATAQPAGGAGLGPATLDEVLIDEQSALENAGEVSVVAFRAMQTATAPIDQLDTIVDTVNGMITDTHRASGAAYSVQSGLPDLVETLAPDQSLLRSSITAVSAQVTALVWFVLFLVVASATDERANEVAIAKLRGRRTRSTLAFAVAEPMLLTTLAVPFGLVLAWGAIVVMGKRWFVAGTPVSFDGTVLLAAAIALVGGLVACLLAARKVLTVSVNDELRRTPSRRTVSGLVLDAVVATLVIVSVTQIRGGNATGVALLAPGLISLALALLALRLLPVVVRRGVTRTRASRRVASFLSLRNVARRPGGGRLVVLLTVAVGLAVFAVDGAAVAAEQRVVRAEVEIGAPTVVGVAGNAPQDLLTKVAAIDPAGAWAMAAVQLPSGSAPALLAVDSARLATVTAWTPDQAAGTVSEIAAALTPPNPAQPVTVAGSIHVTATLSATTKKNTKLTAEEYRPSDDPSVFPTVLRVTVRLPDGRVVSTPIGDIGIGTQEVSAPLIGCDDGCVLSGFVAQGLGARNTALSFVNGAPRFRTTLRLTSITDSTGQVPLDGAPDRWRIGPSEASLVNPDLAAGATVEGTGDDVTLELRSDLPRDVFASWADHPALLPTFNGSSVNLHAYAGDSGGFYAAGLSGTTILVSPIGGSSILPRLGVSGIVSDLTNAWATDPRGTSVGTSQVWLGAAAPPDALQQLGASGLTVTRVETVEGRSKELAQDGTALPFPYFVVAAVLAVILAGGALLVTAAVGSRRRAYELAALRILGASRRTLVSAGRRELALLTLFGCIVGVVAGLAAAWLVLPFLPSTAPNAAYGVTSTGPAWPPVLVLVGLVVVAALVLAHLAARRIAQMSVPELLRETQA